MISKTIEQMPDTTPHEPLLVNGEPFNIANVSSDIAVEHGNSYKKPVPGFNDPFKWTRENVDGPFIPEIDMTGLELEVQFDEQNAAHDQAVRDALYARR